MMNNSKIDWRLLSTIFFFSIISISIIAAMASIIVIIAVVVVHVEKCYTIMIGILQKHIVIVVAYKICSRSLVEDPTIGVDIDQYCSHIHFQVVLTFTAYKKIYLLGWRGEALCISLRSIGKSKDRI